MEKRLLLRSGSLLFTSLLALCAMAQRGTISGKVIATENGRPEPQPFASVVIKGTTTGASTDMDGRYFFKVEPGDYTLTCSLIGFPPVEKPVHVAPDQTIELDLELQNGAQEMKAVEVVKEKRTDTETAVVMEVRRSEQVVSGVGRQQIARGQDRTAGDVLKRVAGVTLVNDRFVMIRGLADRYNTVLLNDVIAPSMEPDKRAFSFDLIPSQALDRVLVNKTGAPELPGEFAGGVIRVSTLSVPDENVTKVSYAMSYREGTTGRTFLTNPGSSTDLLGFDSGARALPGSFPATLSGLGNEQLSALGRQLPNDWKLGSTTAAPDQRFGLFIARRFGKDGGVRFGNVTTVDYALTSQAYTASNYNYLAYNAATGHSDSLYRYADQENMRTARISVLHNWTAMLGSRTKIEFKNLLNQIGESRTTLRTGVDFDGSNEVRNYAMRWQQRTIYSGQLHASHDLNDRTKVDLTAGFGLALSEEPDYRRARTQRNIGQTDSDTPYAIQIAPTASTIDAGRFYSKLNENVLTGKGDIERSVEYNEGKTTAKYRAGFYVERKDRTFDARWMSYVRSNFFQFDENLLTQPLDVALSAANINSTTGFKLGDGTNPSDHYTAANTLLAGYVSGSFVFNKKVNVSGGARVEQNRQELTSGTYTNGKVRVDNAVLSVLPSINASYNLTERSLVRIAAAQAVNRPEFRELAPFSFYDFSSNTSISGNPELKTARILNLDARWELYPSNNENISVGAFYKRFTDPIETFFVSSTGGGTRNLTFGNAANANSVGLEVEVRRSLTLLSKSAWAERWGVVLNASVIKSEVDLGSAAVGQRRTRPMMGQSPYVANAGLYYDDKNTDLRVSLLWNVFGERLYAVGSDLFPDIYEMPRNSLDLTFAKGIGKHFELKVGVQDILNQRVLLKQDSNGDGQVTDTDDTVLSFRRGQYFSAGFTYRF